MLNFEAMRTHLSHVSVFADPAPLLALALILSANFVLTLVHSLQEYRGRLWRYFGAIAGISIPDWVGVSGFSVALTLALWAVGIAGVAGGVPPVVVVPEALAVASIGILIGGRVADGVFSHVRLHRAGFQPNPGLTSTPFYFVEAAGLAVLFFPGLSGRPLWTAAGLALGLLGFWSVLPALRLARKIPLEPIRALRREPWRPGTPRPDWAR